METLKLNRIKTVVATSSIKEKTAAIFEQYQLSPLFDVIVTGDQVEKVKPDPALYLEAQKRLDMPSQSLLVLEDSVTGASAANSAGLPFIIIPDNSSNSTIKIPDNFKYMITVLDSLESVEKWLYRNKCFDF
ncbi:HAD-IA family hydrolase [Tetragenococcus solitarius]|uniref:HAD-IA family hydrolase n=1 Tax=Tetragenococcus solitarius TaxID=71453 RepID=UPI003CD0600E